MFLFIFERMPHYFQGIVTFGGMSLFSDFPLTAPEVGVTFRGLLPSGRTYFWNFMYGTIIY